MRGLERIGAAFVDSEEGYEALRAAGALASACGAELHAATAVEPVAWSAASSVQPYDVRTHLDKLCGRAEERLRSALGGLVPPVPSHVEVLVNRPVTALGQLSHDVDLLVCGSRGRGRLGGVMLGSVSAGVMRKARCPVLVIPRGAPDGFANLPAPVEAAV
jgi:nucleotide-binding universal stress UspA family protein